MTQLIKCPKCKGKGELEEAGFLLDCPKCDGHGHLSLDGSKVIVLQEDDGEHA